MSWHVVANVEEIAPGTSKLVTVKGREIGIFNIKGEYFALLNKCPHQGASLCRGSIVGLVTSNAPGEYKVTRQGEIVRCPWHGWEYDIRTGQSWCDPDDVRTKSYAVTVEAGERIAKGPFVVETFPVLAEENYVLLDI